MEKASFADVVEEDGWGNGTSSSGSLKKVISEASLRVPSAFRAQQSSDIMRQITHKFFVSTSFYAWRRP
jgi:hypothetical protein